MDEGEIKAAISQDFSITNTYAIENGYEYYVESKDDAKACFIKLYWKLYNEGYIPSLTASGRGMLISVVKAHEEKHRGRILPLALILASALTILLDGYFRLRGSVEPLLLNISIYAASLLAFIAAHELGLLLIRRKWRTKNDLPYLIPGIPTSIPIMGNVSLTNGYPINRDQQFDMGYAGLISGLFMAIALFVLGMRFPVSIIKINLQLPIILKLLGYSNVSSISSPIVLASLFGLLITFLNFMPIWQLDGGHMISSILSRRLRIITDFASIIVMSLLGFFYLAFLMIILSSWSRVEDPLDNISKVSLSRKAVYAGLLAIMVAIFILFLTPLVLAF